MQASRPGGVRADRQGQGLRSGRRGACRRLACFLLILLALSGHSRRLAHPIHEGLGLAVAEVILQRHGAVIARGSGVVVAARDEAGERACYLLTAGHVVSPAAESSDLVVVLAGSETPHTLPGELLVTVDADDEDLAVVRAVAPECWPVALGSAVKRGADVWLAGFPAQGEPRFWAGQVRETPVAPGLSWTIEAGVTEGASGGGVFDARTGALVGLIQGYWTVRLVGPAGTLAGEVAAGRTAIIPIGRVRDLLHEWGYAHLIGE